MSERTAQNANGRWTRTLNRRGLVLLRRSLWLGLALSLAGAGIAKAQITTISNGSQLSHPEVIGSMPDPYNGPRDSDPALRQERIHEMNILRQQEVVSNTNKLVKLTAQLNAEIKQSHAKSLTHHQLRMLAKIEKLAKSVREDMTTSMETTGFH